MRQLETSNCSVFDNWGEPANWVWSSRANVVGPAISWPSDLLLAHIVVFCCWWRLLSARIMDMASTIIWWSVWFYVLLQWGFELTRTHSHTSLTSLPIAGGIYFGPIWPAMDSVWMSGCIFFFHVHLQVDCDLSIEETSYGCDGASGWTGLCCWECWLKWKWG